MEKRNVYFSKPSQEQLNSLLEYYQDGRYVDAEKLSLSITQEFPEHPFAWKVHRFFSKNSKSEISKGLCGAPARSRTADLLITNQLLYQLSYKGVFFKQQMLYISILISSTLFFT